MKERPILFSATMVRAILEGRKTQTRRVLKHQPIICTELPVLLFPQSRDEVIEQTGYIWPNAKEQIAALCPYGNPGDRLWVRETWAFHPDFPESTRRAIHRADAGVEYDVPRWRPSIHMPRWASRIMLEITGVRVERLQDISESDAESEGVAAHDTARKAFACLWNDINGAGSWAANPWVWCVSFKRVA